MANINNKIIQIFILKRKFIQFLNINILTLENETLIKQHHNTIKKVHFDECNFPPKSTRIKIKCTAMLNNSGLLYEYCDHSLNIDVIIEKLFF